MAAKRRAAIYCRVSTAAQADDDRVSLDQQLLDCEAYCAAQGDAIVLRITDVGSGTSSRRPGFQRLLQAIEGATVDVVVCWKVDRLGRGLFPMARLLEVCDPHGVSIEAVKERVDPKYLGLLASVGKIELDNIRERTRDMRRAYARQGKVANGMTRYGYRVGDDGCPEIDPAEQPILLEAAERYAAGESALGIGNDLRARGVPARAPAKVRRGAWSRTVVLKLLLDRAYLTGERFYGGERVAYPPLYTPDLWARLVNRRERNTTLAKRNTKLDYLLRGLLRCRCCNTLLVAKAKYTRSRRVPPAERLPDGRQWRTVPLDPPYRCYVCVAGDHHSGYRGRCPLGSAHGAAKLERRVWDTLVEALDDPVRLLAGLEARRRSAEARVREAALELAPDAPDGDPERALALLRWERLNVARERVRGKLDEATLDALLGELDSREAQMRTAIEAQSALRAALADEQAALARAAESISALRAKLQASRSSRGSASTELPFAARRELVLALVERIWVEPEEGSDRGWALTIEGVLGETAAAGAEEGVVAFRRSSKTEHKTPTAHPLAGLAGGLPFALAVPAG